MGRLAVVLVAAAVLGVAPVKPIPPVASKPVAGARDAGRGLTLYGPFPPEMQAQLDKMHYDAGAYLPPSTPFQWDVPKFLNEVDVPGSVNTNGIPSRFHVVEVGVGMEEAYQYFYRSFIKQGLWVSKPEHQMELGDGQVSLTGYDPNAETSYTVLLGPIAKTRTQVILGEAYWKNATFKSGATFAPVYPGAESVVTQNLEGAHSMAFRTRAKKEEVEAFYKAELEQAGWSHQPDTTWTRGDQVIHVFIKAPTSPGLLDVGLITTRVQLGQPPPGPTP